MSKEALEEVATTQEEVMETAAEEREANPSQKSPGSNPVVPSSRAGATSKATSIEKRRTEDDTFGTIRVLEQLVSPYKPVLRMHPKKFLQIEGQDRAVATHAGGIVSRVRVTGFYTDKYAKEIYNFVESRKEALGTSPSDSSSKIMKEKVKEFYEMCFRGETAALQVIMGEYRISRHFHDGRPRGTYCYKCRLRLEISYLARPWQMSSKKVEPMQWFNMSDVESQDDAIVEKVGREREHTWAEMNVAGFQEGKRWRRSMIMKPRTEEDTVQDTAESDQDSTAADQAGTAAEGNTGGRNTAEKEGQEAVSPGVKELTRVMSAVLKELTPKKKRKKAGRRHK